MRSHLDEADFVDGEEVFVGIFAQLRRAAIATIRATAHDRPIHQPAALAADGAEITDPAVITEADWLALFTEAGADVIGDVVVDSAAGVGITYGFDVADPAVQQVAAEQIAGLEQWGGALRHQVTRWVEDGLRQGWGVDEMIANLPTNSPLSDSRARTIARTEMNAAANMGVLAGWAMAGIEGKMWLTAHDSRVRPDHVEMDQVVVAFEDDFLVGGHPARAPGDPRLPPSERVNCRCTLIAVEADQLREHAATTRGELAAKNEQLGLPVRGASKAQLQRQALSRTCAGSTRRGTLTAAASAAASACPATVESLSRTELLIHGKELRISGRHSMSTDDLRAEVARARLIGTDDASREAAGFAPKSIWSQAIDKAKAKAHAVPQPSDADVEKGLEEASLARAGLASRAGGDRRGSAEARRRRAAAMFTEFDGQQNGYVACVYCGRKVHFADAARFPDLNPLGYPKFEQDKLIDGLQGGTYKIANLVPACVPCNRARSNLYHGFGKPSWGDPVKNAARVAKAVGRRYTPGGVAGASTIRSWPATRSPTGRATSPSSPVTTSPDAPSVRTAASTMAPSGPPARMMSPPASWSVTSPSSTSPSATAATTPSPSTVSPSIHLHFGPLEWPPPTPSSKPSEPCLSTSTTTTTDRRRSASTAPSAGLSTDPDLSSKTPTNTTPPTTPHPPAEGWVTHSHGKRKAKGRRPGTAGGDPSYERAKGAGGGGGRVDRSQITEQVRTDPTTGRTYNVEYSVQYGDRTIRVDGKSVTRDEAADYMDSIATGLDIVPLKTKTVTVHAYDTMPRDFGPRSDSTAGWVSSDATRGGVYAINVNHPLVQGRTGKATKPGWGVAAPDGSGFTPAQKTVLHEYGHLQDYRPGGRGTPHVSSGMKPPEGARDVSNYAGVSDSEFHAEAFAAHALGVGGTERPLHARDLVPEVAKANGWLPSPHVTLGPDGKEPINPDWPIRASNPDMGTISQPNHDYVQVDLLRERGDILPTATSTSSAWVTHFETHSHGKRKNKGRQPGAGDPGGGGSAGQAADVVAGKPVTVQPGDVAGVIDHFADESGPVDLTLVTVAGKPNLFSAMRGNGIARADMPQIPRDHLVGFQADLAKRGVKVTPGRRKAADLKATQSELNGQAVGKLQRNIQDGSFDLESKPTWVSSDGHVLDGHHRWAAAASLDRELPVIEVGLPMSRLLQVAQDFTDAQGIRRKAIGAATDQPPFDMATDAEDGIDDADLVDLPHGDGSAFVESAGQQSSWLVAFETHSHGKRKAKGRRKGVAPGSDPSYEKAKPGGGGGGGGDTPAGGGGGGGGDLPPPAGPPVEAPTAASRDFQNAAAGRAWAGDEFAGWQKSVTPDERAAMKRYTQDGSVLMNEPLRGKRPVDAITRRFAVPAVKAMHRHQLSEPITGVRGAFFDDATLAKLQPGTTFVDKGFTSTTLNARPPRTINANTVFHVKMPAGTRGGYVTPFATGNVKGEAEFTLPPGSTFKIGSVAKRNGKTEITMELVSQEPEASVLKRLGA